MDLKAKQDDTAPFFDEMTCNGFKIRGLSPECYACLTPDVVAELKSFLNFGSSESELYKNKLQKNAFVGVNDPV
jgi:hypothetical protein